MDAELQVFESLYLKAKIKVVYLSEYEAIQYMLKDSARLAIVTRELNEEERAVLKEQKISNPRYHKLGYDAVPVRWILDVKELGDCNRVIVVPIFTRGCISAVTVEVNKCIVVFSPQPKHAPSPHGIAR